MLPINPFIHGRSLTATELVGRASTLRKLASRLDTGQSVAIVGQPHLGKTSLLNYLLTEGQRRASSDSRPQAELFSYIDFHGLYDVENLTRFWELALAPLSELGPLVPAADASGIGRTLDEARRNQFRTAALETLFGALRNARLRLVLLLDEFDACLAQPVLNSPAFYGGLRTLSSRSGALALVIAARRDIEQLNDLTQAVNPTGSPYLNTLIAFVLGPLSEKELAVLLDRAGDRFDARDRAFIARVSGGHPYLAQAAAAAMWEADDDGAVGTERYRAAGHAMYQQVKHHFADTWKCWSNATRKAVTAVALAETPRLLAERAFDVAELHGDVEDYTSELTGLQEMGLLRLDESGGWSVTQGAFLWWLADEIRRNVRDETDFRTWLHAQEMEGTLTHEQQQRLTTAARTVMAALGKGATTLIEALAKGFGEGTAKAALKP